MLDKITVSEFSEHLNSTFRMHPESGDPLEVKLIEATELSSGSGPGEESRKRKPFSLVFRGPKEPELPQKIYKMEHGKLGTLDFFLVPIGPDQEGMCYQAVFN